MEEKLALSVLIPAYNSGKTLARALTSLLVEQRFSHPYEVLLLLDPSTDDSLAIAESFASRFPFFHLIAPQERWGIGRSRIEGIERAKGKYFYFMDADDYLAPNALETLYQTIEESQSDCVNCAFYYVKNGKPHLFPWRLHKTLQGQAILEHYFDDSSIRGFCWTKIYRREIAERRPLLVLAAPLDMQFEDVALNCALLSYAQKVVSIKDPLYYYVKDNTSSAMSKPRKNRAFRHLVVFALERYFLESQKNTLGLKAFQKKLFRASLSLHYDLRLDRKNGADAAYRKSVREGFALLKDMKTPLVKEGSFFEKDADAAFYFRKEE
jgi:glycosyltransferase involved in cell wall biosynthesis